MPPKFGGAPKCPVCEKSAYPQESVDLGAGQTYHKNCFKCMECKMPLNQQNYGADSGKIYCKKHFQSKVTAKNAQI